MARTSIFIGALLVLATITAVAAAPAPKSLYSIISADPKTFSTLKTLVDRGSKGPVNFIKVLNDTKQNITVFAPTNAAFAKLTTALGATAANAALNNASVITQILLTHVLGVRAFSSQLKNNQVVTTLGGVNLTVLISGKSIKIRSPGSTANVILPNITGGNSIAHVIDTVLLPAALPKPSPSPKPSLTTYENLKAKKFTLLLNMIDYVSKASATNRNLTNWKALLSNPTATYTLFAPTDKAIQALIDLAGPAAQIVLTNAPLQNSVLAAHAVATKVNPGKTGATFTTLGGQKTQIVVTLGAGNKATYKVVNPFTSPAPELTYPGYTIGNAITYPISSVLMPVSVADLAAQVLGK